MATTDTAVHDRSHQAYQVLHIGFTIAPILAGLDKFFNLLTNWEKYLAPFVTQTLGISATTFMMAVGVIEIVAGLLMWFKPRLGGYIVMAWLWAIIINLLLIPGYFDVALRDFGLSLGALALARLAEVEVPAHVAGRVRTVHA